VANANNCGGSTVQILTMVYESGPVDQLIASGHGSGWWYKWSGHGATHGLPTFSPTLSHQPSLPPNGPTQSPWKGPITFTTCLRSEPGTEARRLLSIVRRVVRSSRRDHTNRLSKHRFSFNAVSQLDRDASTALAAIREWRNSLVPINRLPVEVLSLIPIHLYHEGDLFRASFVCRRWRRAFIQHAALWSRLSLTIQRGDLYAKTLLERAKGTVLDIRSSRLDRADILALLSPRAQRFGTLDFVREYWSHVQKFSEATPGPLPLLHTLKINAVQPEVISFGSIDLGMLRSSSPPLFSGAINMKNLILHSEGEPFLNHFAFPNLETLELTITLVDEEFLFSNLLDFLEASPTLKTVRIRIVGGLLLERADLERVVVLPNAEIFSMTQDEPDCRILAPISCPAGRLVSFVCEQEVGCERQHGILQQDIFPTSDSWDVTCPQYMAGTIDEVVLEITTAGDLLSCSLSFLLPGQATFELGYKTVAVDEYQHHTPDSLGEVHSRVFSRALKAVRGHPLLSTVKRLRIQDRHAHLALDDLAYITKAVGRLFELVGPLEELILDVDDLRPFISSFFDPPQFQVLLRPFTFPSIKGLTIIEHPESPFNGGFAAAILGFVKSQHTRGVPFERANFHIEFPPVGMAERLEPWVDAVHFS
jgi:hypothetical protein